MVGSIPVKVMANYSLDSKRLETIRRQLYGKNPTEKKIKTTTSQTNSLSKDSQQSSTSSLSYQPIPQTTPLLNQDTSYLKKDLTKILILSMLAIGIQICLYLGSINRFLLGRLPHP